VDPADVNEPATVMEVEVSETLVKERTIAWPDEADRARQSCVEANGSDPLTSQTRNGSHPTLG
jgi:hypothetical protein